MHNNSLHFSEVFDYRTIRGFPANSIWTVQSKDADMAVLATGFVALERALIWHTAYFSKCSR
jgi:hypothetical protein